MTSRVCNDISVAHGHQVLSIIMIDELLSQVQSEWIFCVITGKKYVFVLMQVPSSTEKYQYIGSRSLGLASATFPCCRLDWGHITVVISDNPHLYIALSFWFDQLNIMIMPRALSSGGSLYNSVVVWSNPSGCINARFVHANSCVPITSSRSISSLEDRAITNTPAKSDDVVFWCRSSAPAVV